MEDQTCLCPVFDLSISGLVQCKAEESPDDVDYLLGDLCGDLLLDCRYAFTNHYEEMQHQMGKGKPAITCLLHPNIKGISEFLTYLLFSSPQIHFLDQQKRASCTGPDVTSCFTLLQSPTEKRMSLSGNIDFANLKILMDLPDDLAPPSIWVNGKVFFVNKLLQQSTKRYFILTKLFQAQVSPTPETKVLSLKNRVSQTDKGFVVDPEQVIVLVSTFSHIVEELSSCSDASGVTSTGSSHIYSIYYSGLSGWEV
ncbi:hypothetical protein EV363DRAFT_1403310 [Boletus edulis]|nr:hypothetical protein EV363DRAFT_1403310 [Boletus edulis]